MGFNWVDIVMPIILAVVGAVLAMLGKLIQAKIKTESVQLALMRIVDAVHTAVSDTQKSVVEPRQAMHPKTSLSMADAAMAKEQALVITRKLIGEKNISDIQKKLQLKPEEFTRMISAKVEEAVLQLPKKRPIAAPPQPSDH